MASIGIIPTKSTIELREPDGDAGTIPGATAAAAGVMTAQQVRQLEEVWGRLSGVRAAAALGRGTNDNASALAAEMSSIAERLDGLEAVGIQHAAALAATPRASGLPPDLVDRIQHLQLDIEALKAAPRPQPVPPGADPRLLAAMAERLDGLEQRLAEPVGFAETEPFPAFLDRARARQASVSPDDLPPALRQTTGPEHLPAISALAIESLTLRLDALERRSERSNRPEPLATIAAARQRIAETAPPLRAVEAAHLARSGQDIPIALMEGLGDAMGCGWEEAAISVIRQHDEVTQRTVAAYAIEIRARQRIAAGEDGAAVMAESLAAINGLGDAT